MTRKQFIAVLIGLFITSMSVEALAAGAPRDGSGRRGGGYTQNAPRSAQPNTGAATAKDSFTQPAANTGQRPAGYGRGTGPRNGAGPGSGPRDGSGPNHVDGQPSRWDVQSK